MKTATSQGLGLHAELAGMNGHAAQALQSMAKYGNALESYPVLAHLALTLLGLNSLICWQVSLDCKLKGLLMQFCNKSISVFGPPGPERGEALH